MIHKDKFNSPVYWQIGTDIKLSFPTKKEYEEAIRKGLRQGFIGVKHII